MTSHRMSDIEIKKEIVSIFIDSPLYFTMPLQRRLELVTQYRERRSYVNIELINYLLNWIETGNFIKPSTL